MRRLVGLVKSWILRRERTHRPLDKVRPDSYEAARDGLLDAMERDLPPAYARRFRAAVRKKRGYF